ncbi:MAG: V-type ATP synthase subunit B [Deltaproteobacteria bacterium]
MRLSEYRYSSIASIQGPLLFVEHVRHARMGEMVQVLFPDGTAIEGEILKADGRTVLIQVFGDSRGLNLTQSSVVFSDSVKQVPLSLDMLDRIFDGSFKPIDRLPMFVPEKYTPVTGFPINPAGRGKPEEFIETGFSAIDVLNTLVKGQKLPIFSCAGLPAKELLAAILRNAGQKGVAPQVQGRTDFVVVFVALGLTHHEFAFYMKTLHEMQSRFIAFINLASDPAVERLLAPRFGLAAAEYLAFEKGMDALVVIADITNYCDALREISTAREELPGRRGYPGYMYSDLASLFERAGRIKGRPGSVTMLPMVTMPEDDITHPIPDLTGYITEGQIVLSREMHQKMIFPPIDALPSLSRLMQHGIGKDHTRSDHRSVANQLYQNYARGRDLRNLEAIVGREGMGAHDAVYLDFAAAFEKRFVGQGEERRAVDASIEEGIDLLRKFGLFKE